MVSAPNGIDWCESFVLHISCSVHATIKSIWKPMDSTPNLPLFIHHLQDFQSHVFSLWQYGRLRCSIGGVQLLINGFVQCHGCDLPLRLELRFSVPRMLSSNLILSHFLYASLFFTRPWTSSEHYGVANERSPLFGGTMQVLWPHENFYLTMEFYLSRNGLCKSDGEQRYRTLAAEAHELRAIHHNVPKVLNSGARHQIPVMD